MRTPKRIKWRSGMKRLSIPKLKVAKRGFMPAYGKYALIAVEPGRLTSRQQEAGRKVIARRIKKIGRFFMNVFPDRIRTEHATGTKMGKGKGKMVDYIAIIHSGTVIYEVIGPEAESKEALKMVGYKMPFKTKVISTQI